MSGTDAGPTPTAPTPTADESTAVAANMAGDAVGDPAATDADLAEEPGTLPEHPAPDDDEA